MHFAKVLVTASTLFSIASAATFNVTVGRGGLTFDPPSVSGVAAGDTILFQFPSSTPHSATQSTFDSPCTARSSGMDSGVVTSSSSPSSYSAAISDVSTPLWFYCKVGSHCQSGMVFAVNPTSEQSFDAFKAKAAGGSASGSSTPASTSKSAGASGSSTPSSSGGYGSSAVKTSIQKMTAGLAGVVLLVGLLA